MMKRPTKADNNNAAGLLNEAELLVEQAMDLLNESDGHLMTVRQMLTLYSLQCAMECGMDV